MLYGSTSLQYFNEETQKSSEQSRDNEWTLILCTSHITLIYFAFLVMYFYLENCVFKLSAAIGNVDYVR